MARRGDGESVCGCAPAVLCIRQRPDCAGVYLVAVTGYGQPQDRQSALDAGFDQHLVKPAEIEQLRELFDPLAQRCVASP